MKLYNYNGSAEYTPESQYKWRLNWLRNQIKIRESRGEKISQKQKDKWHREEKHTYENQTKDFELINRMDKDTCILVCTHYYQNVWLHACLESLRKLGYYIILLYDNPFWDDKQKVEDRMPKTKTIMLADQLLMKPKTWQGGVGAPHSWHMYLGTRMAHSLGFKYTFCINGDCILEKPENFPKLRKMLGDNDAISCQYIEGKYFGTMAYLMKTKYILKLWDMNMENLYRYNIGNAEGRLGTFSKQLGMKITPVINPSNPHFHPNDNKATFRKLLGLRHPHAELKIRRREKMIPVEEKYFDKDFMNQKEKVILETYWRSGKKKHLKAWWEL